MNFFHFQGRNVPPGPEPADLVNSTITLILPVVVDTSAIGRSFGDVIEQPPTVVRRGDTVRVVFVSVSFVLLHLSFGTDTLT